MKNKFLWLLCLCFLLSVFLPGCRSEAASAPSLTVDFYKIGKADAILLHGEGRDNAFSVLIDAGEEEDAPEILAELRRSGVSSLDLLILTHFDRDHIGGIPAILEKIPAKRILMPAYKGTGEPYDALLSALAGKEDVTEILSADAAFSLGLCSFSVSVPESLTYTQAQDNNSSLAVTVTFEEHTLFFPGDAEKLRQEELLDGGLSHVTLLKVPHHGEWNKKLNVFFEALTPDYAVITSSDKNPADNKTLTALEALEAEIYETRNGSVRFRFADGEVHIDR